MKITHITPGLLPIPPNGWGAVEKIIWAYHTQLLKLGHDSQIKYCSDVSKEDKGVIHVHVANLALELRDKNIPYFFTMHDHHAFLYGKNSPAFKQNKEAIEGSILSFAPANYLIEYFGGHKLEYLSHGVDTHFFSPERYVPRPIKLLCVANNGFIHNNSEDRKGFGFAISAAQKLGLPITVAGPSNNKHFFHSSVQTYDKLTILYDLSEDELVKVYRDHSIFIHPSLLEAGHPNLTLLEAQSCGLPIVGTFEDNKNLTGMIKVNRSSDEIVTAVQKIIKYFPVYRVKAIESAQNHSWDKIVSELLKAYSIPF